MDRIYKDKNVYLASQDRIRLIFDNFDKIYVSFSGGEGQRCDVKFDVRLHEGKWHYKKDRLDGS